MKTRRSFIASLSAAAMAPSLPAFAGVRPDRAGSRLDALIPVIEPRLDLWSPHTDEKVRVTFFSATGYDADAVRRLNWFMRDWRERQATQIDVRLFWALAAIRQAGMKEGNAGIVNVNSGFRSRRTNEKLRLEGRAAAPNSFHIQGRAVDFTMPGADVADLARFAGWLEVGGTGHYKSSFVHVDTAEVRTWFG